MNSISLNTLFDQMPMTSDHDLENYTEEEKLQIAVTILIQTCGMPANLRGYRFTRSALVLTVQNPELAESITKLLYPEIAKNYSVGIVGVERAIRHAIEVVWKRGGYNALNSYFGCSIWQEDKRPTNHEFIATIADQLRLKLRMFK